MPARLVRIAFTPGGFAGRGKVCVELPNQGDKFFDETLEVDIPPLDYPAGAGGADGTMRDAGDDGPDFPQQVGTLADVERVGDRLFRCLIPDHRVSEFQAARNAAGNKGLRIRLNLCQANDDTASIAWEAIRLPDDTAAGTTFLALNPRYPLVRQIDRLSTSPPPPPSPGPLDVLIAIAVPRDDLDAAREIESIGRALERIAAAERFRFRTVNPATRESLADAIAQPPDVIHFIGHGASVDGMGAIQLLTEDRAGAIALSSRDLRMMMSAYGMDSDGRSRLVVLNSCRTGAAVRRDRFAGMAQNLIAGGIDHVVAMQFPISDESAVKFAGGFYAALARGMPVDAAAALGRHAIYNQDDLARRLEFVTPVVYSRHETPGPLLAPADAAAQPADAATLAAMKELGAAATVVALAATQAAAAAQAAAEAATKMAAERAGQLAQPAPASPPPAARPRRLLMIGVSFGAAAAVLAGGVWFGTGGNIATAPPMPMPSSTSATATVTTETVVVRNTTSALSSRRPAATASIRVPAESGANIAVAAAAAAAMHAEMERMRQDAAAAAAAARREEAERMRQSNELPIAPPPPTATVAAGAEPPWVRRLSYHSAYSPHPISPAAPPAAVSVPVLGGILGIAQNRILTAAAVSVPFARGGVSPNADTDPLGAFSPLKPASADVRYVVIGYADPARDRRAEALAVRSALASVRSIVAADALKAAGVNAARIDRFGALDTALPGRAEVTASVTDAPWIAFRATAITPTAVPADPVMRVAAYLKSNPQAQVLLRGHAGLPAPGDTLAEGATPSTEADRRARVRVQSVAYALRTVGIARTRIRAEAYGATMPLVAVGGAPVPADRVDILLSLPQPTVANGLPQAE